MNTSLLELIRPLLKNTRFVGFVCIESIFSFVGEEEKKTSFHLSALCMHKQCYNFHCYCWVEFEVYFVAVFAYWNQRLLKYM